MNLDELRSAVQHESIDTVALAIPDMQGRLVGKRLTATHFLDEVLPHGAEGCNYLLATNVEMMPVPGYAMSSWDLGYGDFMMIPDIRTLRRLPWLEATALCIADVQWENGDPVAASPRGILQRQLDRLAERGWTANVGTELEFLIFNHTYEDAWQRGYRDLTPSNLYNTDYSLAGTARIEEFIRKIRNSMVGAGMRVENSKGECNLGQHEINFRYTDALSMADNHVIYKNGVKEIASIEGVSISFMAKWDEREGNSCHIHLSLANEDGSNVFAANDSTFKSFLAGQLDCLRELCLLYAPNVNSYKRVVPGAFAPTAVAWGRDNRTCALRVVGHGQALRLENRLPGGDVNPYMAIAAMIASGLHGIDRGLDLEPAFDGNAYESEKARVPTTLRDAQELFAQSGVAREAFGEEVVSHYVHAAEVELEEFDAAVTDWEKYRGFERL
ncbi:MAG TPA: glutamine synthetase family protein [Thermoleophilaceae bacterium]